MIIRKYMIIMNDYYIAFYIKKFFVMNFNPFHSIFSLFSLLYSRQLLRSPHRSQRIFFKISK